MSDEKEETKKDPVIDELTIIRSCMTQLRKLDPVARRRVCVYLLDRGQQESFAAVAVQANKAATLAKSNGRDDDAFG